MEDRDGRRIMGAVNAYDGYGYGEWRQFPIRQGLLSRDTVLRPAAVTSGGWRGKPRRNLLYRTADRIARTFHGEKVTGWSALLATVRNCSLSACLLKLKKKKGKEKYWNLNALWGILERSRSIETVQVEHPFEVLSKGFRVGFKVRRAVFVRSRVKRNERAEMECPIHQPRKSI